MNKKTISRKKIIVLLLEGLLWGITMAFFSMSKITYTVESFRMLSVYTLLISILLIIIQVRFEGGIIKPFSIIFICFVLFQAGLPMLYGIDSAYTEWNIEFISLNNRIDGLKYTIHCFHAFSVGSIIGTQKNNKTVNLDFKCLQNENLVRHVSHFLAITSGLIAIPLAMFVFSLSMRYGYTYIKLDTMGFNNGLTNLARTLFPAAIFLSLVYARNKREKNISLFFIVFYGVLTTAAGGRTIGLAMFLALIYYYYDSGDKKTFSNYIKKNIFLILAIVVLVFTIVAVKNFRTGRENEFGLLRAIESVVKEMGFNFTSIGFTKIFVPEKVNFKYGLTYLCAIACLIPSSLDPTGIISYCKSVAGEGWLTEQLHTLYGATFDYGVGFSIVAESYLNFSVFGWIIVLLQGIIVKKVLSLEFRGGNKFCNYIKIIMLWSLTTYPRRSFFTLVKAIEYDVLLIIMIIWIINRLIYRKVGRT